MGDYLEGWSPFQTEVGRFSNSMRIGLGEDRGWMELSTHGELVIYSAECPDEPVFRFNAEDAEMLIAVGQELAIMVDAWQEFQKEKQEEQAKLFAPDEAEPAIKPVEELRPRSAVLVKPNGAQHSALAGD